MTLRHVLALLAMPALLGVGALGLGSAGAGPLASVDAAGLALAARAHGPFADTFFRIITWGGSVLVLGPLAILLAAQAWRRCTLLQASFVPLTLFGATLVAHAAKLIIDRDRPQVPLLVDLPPDASFPSAHTMQITAVVVACWVAPTRRHAATRLPALAAGVTAIMLVAWSRLHLQVHFPSDILFGLAAGAVWALALRQLPCWNPKP